MILNKVYGFSLRGLHNVHPVELSNLCLVDPNFHFQLISTLALVAAASAQYAPAPVVVAKEVPQPYAYEYGVADDYSKANFRKTETQDAAGNVGGSFTIALPDGRIQTTTYTADHTNGFVAEVTYSGEAVYPPAPAGGYPGEAHAAPAPGYAAGRK